MRMVTAVADRRRSYNASVKYAKQHFSSKGRPQAIEMLLPPRLRR
jgi:hypothetical protein